MDRIGRIGQMEEKLDAALEAIRALEDAAEAYASVLEDIRALDGYLSGEDWRADYDADEKGLLPPDLKRGVLSEDGIYDMLEDNREVLERLRALVRQADELADQAPGMGRECTAPEED